MFILPGNAGQITARWGLLAPRRTIDPGALDAIDEPNWILDTDPFQSFQTGSRWLDVDSVVEQARAFAERIYSIFRWAVTNEFLRRYGGNP